MDHGYLFFHPKLKINTILFYTYTQINPSKFDWKTVFCTHVHSKYPLAIEYRRYRVCLSIVSTYDCL